MSNDWPEGLAGDLVLQLADEGMLVLDICAAERVISDIELTLAVVEARRREGAVRRDGGLDTEAMGQDAIDLRFAEVVEPRRIQNALDELPKYLAAFRLATKLSRC